MARQGQAVAVAGRSAGFLFARLPPWLRAAGVLLSLLLLLIPPSAAAPAPSGSAAPARVTLLTIDGAIDPASADYVARGIARAAQNGSELVVLQMDTPGGLDTSMRVIIKAILNSPVPVASYVAPGGARAASAGTYILYASHIAAMAPGTNLGAATPVQLGGGGGEAEPEPARAPAPGKNAKNAKPAKGAAKDAAKDAAKEGAQPLSGSAMTRKHVNDASAYIRGLAQMRGRNVEWAERAVREAVSLPAPEALKLGVIEYVAPDVPALLAQLDGKRVAALGQQRQLHTKNATLIDARPDWHARLLAVIANPSIALLLMTVGVYGLIFEFASPGYTVPGVVGAICLLLAMYALQLLPLNYAGLALILLGIAFMVAEAFLPSFGALGMGGVVAFVAGALILVDTDLPGYGVSLPLVVMLAVASALLLAALAGMALKTRRRRAVGDGLIGSTAQLVSVESAHEGWARVRGETWRVVAHFPLRAAQKVRVVARDGLVLEVIPENDQKQGA
jgi:membrane-bound serine protease (ClpP class)